MKFRKYPVRLLIIYIIAFFTNILLARPNLSSPGPTNDIVESRQFITKSMEIDASAILDAERLVAEGKAAEDLSDSLHQEITILVDTLRCEPFDSTRLIRFVREGLKILDKDLEYVPNVRRIERTFKFIGLKDFQYTQNSLLEYALKQYFQAKKINPYNSQVKIAAFQLLLSKLQQRATLENELRKFAQSCRQTRWLNGEKNGYYTLIGQLYQNFREWGRAYAAYDSAWQLVKDTIYPPGIDSSFSERQDSIATKAFIAQERQLMAEVLVEDAFEVKAIHDSLWLYYEFFSDSTNLGTFTYADSQETRLILDQAIPLIKPVDRLSRDRHRQLVLKKYNFRLTDLEFVLTELFNLVEQQMLRAKQLDPFNQTIRLKLAQNIYYKTAQSNLDSSLYAKAVREFENLIYIQKGNLVYYLNIGDAYMGMKNWQKAYDNYKLAEDVFRETALFSLPNPTQYFTKLDSVPLNPAYLAIFMSRQATAKIKLYDGIEALKLLRLARDYTENPTTKEQYQKQIDLVNWDDGNVHAMNLKALAYRLHSQRNLMDARAAYIRLLDILWTQRTKDEINNQIAFLDFQELDRKEEGVERMRLVVAPMQKDATGAAADGVNQQYFENYGRMCYDFGVYYLNKDNRKLAYIYFTQSTQINWPGRSNAYLQMANLSQFDPLETIKLCNLALKESENLRPGEMRQAAQLLSNAYRKEAKFKEARTWHQKSLDREWCENRQQS